MSKSRTNSHIYEDAFLKIFRASILLIMERMFCFTGLQKKEGKEMNRTETAEQPLLPTTSVTQIMGNVQVNVCRAVIAR